MADRMKLGLQKRTVVGKKVKLLRQEGLLPATVYGKGVGPLTVQLDAKVFNELYRKSGRTTLIDMEVPGQGALAGFVHTLQRHPLTRAISHVDFLAVDLLQPVTMAVPLHIVGTSPLVARGDAILNQSMTTVHLTALPTDIPANIELDISDLDSFEKNVHVRDLVLPSNVTMAEDEDALVVSLGAATMETEEPEAAAEESVEPELIRERRESEEEE